MATVYYLPSAKRPAQNRAAFEELASIVELASGMDLQGIGNIEELHNLTEQLDALLQLTAERLADCGHDRSVDALRGGIECRIEALEMLSAELDFLTREEVGIPVAV